MGLSLVALTNIVALSSALLVGFAAGKWVGEGKYKKQTASRRGEKRRARIKRSAENFTATRAAGLASPPPSTTEPRPSRRSRNRGRKLAPRCLALDKWTRVARSHIESIGAGGYESVLLLPRACFLAAGRFASFAECRHQLVSLGRAREAAAGAEQLRLLHVSSSWASADDRDGGGEGTSPWAVGDFETARVFLQRNPEIGFVHIDGSCVPRSSTGLARSARVIPALLRSDAVLVLPRRARGRHTDFRLGAWSRMVLAVAAVGRAKVFVAFRAGPFPESVLELELEKQGSVEEVARQAADALRDAAAMSKISTEEAVVEAACDNWLGSDMNPLSPLEEARLVVSAALKPENSEILDSIGRLRPAQTPELIARVRTSLGEERSEGGRELALAMLLFTVLCSQPKERATYTDGFLEEAGKAEISYRPIALVRSPYRERFGTPRQPQVTASVTGGAAQEGQLVFFKDRGYEEALEDLSGFDMIWVITHMHLNKGWNSKVRPPRLPEERKGLFSTRSPHRPNAVALSSLRVGHVDVRNGVIHVRGLDLLDGTPVLDIKPYIPYCDAFPNMKAGWLDVLGSDHEEQRDFLPKFSVGATLVQTATGSPTTPPSSSSPAAEQAAQDAL